MGQFRTYPQHIWMVWKYGMSLSGQLLQKNSNIHLIVLKFAWKLLLIQ